MKKANFKLHYTIAEIGKEADTMKLTPGIMDIEDAFYQLKWRIEANDKQGIQKYGRQLGAIVAKFLTEKA